MLRSLDIISLFGIYTYRIDLTDPQGRGLKFITSPNGYGKTTLDDFRKTLLYARISSWAVGKGISVF